MAVTAARCLRWVNSGLTGQGYIRFAHAFLKHGNPAGPERDTPTTCTKGRPTMPSPLSSNTSSPLLRRLALLLLAFSLVAAACGDDDDDSGSGDPDGELATAISEELDLDALPDGFNMDVSCMGTSIVEGMGGAAAIEERYGITAEDVRNGSDLSDEELDADDVEALVESTMSCGDFKGFVVEAIAGEGLAADKAKCLGGELNDDPFRDILTASFTEDAALEEQAQLDLQSQLFAALEPCEIDPSDLG